MLFKPPRSKTKGDLQSVDISAVFFYDGAIFPTITRENARSLRFLHESPTNAMMCFQLLEQTQEIGKAGKFSRREVQRIRTLKRRAMKPFLLLASFLPCSTQTQNCIFCSLVFFLQALSLSLSQRHQTLTLFSKPQKLHVMGARVFIFFQFCDVATLAIILKRNQPNLATCQKGKQNFFQTAAIFWRPART